MTMDILEFHPKSILYSIVYQVDLMFNQLSLLNTASTIKTVVLWHCSNRNVFNISKSAVMEPNSSHSKGVSDPQSISCFYLGYVYLSPFC